MSDLYAGLTPEQADDAKRFLAFMDEWPQDAADADPDEWARAEHLAEFLRERGHDTGASYLVRVFRACELFDSLRAADSQARPDAHR